MILEKYITDLKSSTLIKSTCGIESEIVYTGFKYPPKFEACFNSSGNLFYKMGPETEKSQLITKFEHIHSRICKKCPTDWLSKIMGWTVEKYLIGPVSSLALDW